MKKQNYEQLVFFTQGLAKRFIENITYFQRARVEFKSGRKCFEAQYALRGELLYLSYNGQKQDLMPEAFLGWFREEAMKYDAATLEYYERGAVVRIEADERGVRAKQTDIAADAAGAAAQEAEPLLHAVKSLSGRNYQVRISDAPQLLRAIGILTDDNKLKNDMIRKYNQIDHFVELVRPVLEADPTDIITILDCACGKSYLSFVLNFFIKEVLRRRCYITGVDISQRVIDESTRIAGELGYQNMEFIRADLRTYSAKRPSLVISLHACDTATDMAIGLAVRAGARSIACVPCCHKELLNQYKLPALDPLLRHGVFRARTNDILTDGLRTLKLESLGYKVTAVEYISPLDTPKNLLLLAQKTAQDNPRAQKEYDALRSLLGVEPAIERECAMIAYPED